jgi:long-chain fatty acid transport protein
LLAAIFVAIVLACSFAPHYSSAQALYYRSIPLGERAMGLGGAYTGIADDPSATYYNPAGLVTGGRFQLMGSLLSIVFTRRTVDDAFESPDIESSFTSANTTTLPSFIGTVVKFGRKRFGDHQFAVAYSTFQVARESFGERVSQIEEPASVDLRLDNSYKDRWYGISFAAQVRKNVSLGLTTFLAKQNGNYSEDVGLASGGTLNENGQRIGGNSVTTSTEIGMSAYHFVFRLGALYRINRRWQLGFMFQPPGAPLSESGNVFRRSTTTRSGLDSTYFVFDQGDLSTILPIPFELRTGMEFKINAVTVLSVDASVSGPVRDRGLFKRPDELEGLPGTLGVYFPNSSARRWTPNVAVGAEHMFGKVVIAGGLFTNISSAPDVPATSTEYTPDQVNMFGASFSAGIDTKGYRLTLGATGYFGRGDALSFTLDGDAMVAGYERTKSTVSALVLYVAGAISVASKGAKSVQDSYQERKAKKNGAGDESEPDTDADPVE